MLRDYFMLLRMHMQEAHEVGWPMPFAPGFTLDTHLRVDELKEMEQ